jgi:hypothetical protein
LAVPSADSTVIFWFLIFVSAMTSPSTLPPFEPGETSPLLPSPRPRAASKPLSRFQTGETVAGRFRVTGFLAREAAASRASCEGRQAGRAS